MPGSVDKKQRARKARKEEKKKEKTLPKKTWEKEGAPSATELKNGSRGVDVRSEKSDPREGQMISMQSPGSLNTVTVYVTVTTRSVAYLAMGILLKALKRGSGSAQASVEAPYYMFRYLNDTFLSCMSSGIMKLTTAPLWLWDILYALKPKMARFKTGSVSYSWRINDDGQGVDQAFTLGTNEDSYVLYWGTGAPPPGAPVAVNGFPVLGPVPPYTEELGLQAISALWNYTTQTGEVVCADPGPDGVTTANDTSAFSVAYPELGESYFSQGGVRTTIYSERHIDSPIFCQFGVYQPAGQPFWRGWHDARVGAGSPCLIGPTMIDHKGKYHRNKNVPILKFYNFDEFWEQMCLTLCFAQEKLIAAGESPIPCPLNAIQASLLLRQAILQICHNDAAQDVRYSGSSFIDMIPFVVGPNGSLGGATVPMMLPTFLAENIRAIGAISTKTSKKFNSIVSWVPVLARPPSKELPYKFSYGGGEQLFAPQGDYLPVNLVDVSVQTSQMTLYLELTRVEMQTLCQVWNEWIANLSAVLSPLVTVTAERGLRAINCNTYSNLQEQIERGDIPLTTGGALTKKNSIRKTLGGPGLHIKSKETVVVDGASYFQFIGDRKISSLSGFSTPLDQIIDNFVLPVNLSENALEDASYQGYQAFMIEPSSKPRSSLGGFGSTAPETSLPTAWDRHKRAAAFDVKAFGTAGQNNEVIDAFVELAKQGRGGFLTSALSGLANMILPGSGRYVQQVLEC